MSLIRVFQIVLRGWGGMGVEKVPLDKGEWEILLMVNFFFTWCASEEEYV